MPETQLLVLAAGAAAVAVLHAALGVDHTLPFVIMGRAQGWRLPRLLGITALCGLAHVAASVLLAVAGGALGLTVERIAELDGTRDRAGAWLLIAFGLTYAVWSFWRRRRRGLESGARPPTSGAWALFVVAMLGPCEALIPMMTAPMLAGDWLGAAVVVQSFTLATVVTMVAVVALASLGFGARRIAWLDRWVHEAAGGALALTGVVLLNVV